MSEVTLEIEGQHIWLMLDNKGVCMEHGTLMVEVAAITAPSGQVILGADIADMCWLSLRNN